MDTQQLKLLTGQLRSLLQRLNHSVGYNQALDLIASLPGLRNWPEVQAFPDRVNACELDLAAANRLSVRLKAKFDLELPAHTLLASLVLPSVVDKTGSRARPLEHMVHKEQLKANLARHQAQPGVTPSSYFDSLCLALGQEANSKTRIYLDSCYWVMLREAALGKSRQPELTAILALLRRLVRDGRVICPVSDAAYVETMQHADRDTRVAMAALFDELSQGVCLRTERERVTIELAEFMRSPSGEGSRIPELSWVRTGMVLGVRVPSSPQLDKQTNHLFQKSTIDFMWGMSFQAFAERDKGDAFAKTMEDSAFRINEKMVEYAPTIRSFQQAFAAEVSGSAKFFDEDAARDFLSKNLSSFTEEEVERCKSSMQTMLFNVFRLRPQIMAKRVPALYVHAACHAAVRWDKKRKLNGHWLMDIHHSCAASGHHHAMFTEAPLKALMTSGNLKLDKQFDMPVIAVPSEALHYLQNLEGQNLVENLATQGR